MWRGIFSNELVLAGECFLEYADEIFTTASLQDRSKRYSFYGWVNEYIQKVHFDLHVDATVIGKNARFIKQRCAPNCEALTFDLGKSGYVVPWLRALENVQVGEDIRSVYGWHKDNTDSLLLCKRGVRTCKVYI